MAKVTKTPTENAEEPGSFVPRLSVIDHGHDYPRIDVTPPFILVHSPTRWMVSCGRLVPMPSQIPLRNGVSLVTQDRDGRYSTARLAARLAEEGRTLIPFSWAPDGQSYLQEVETKLSNGEITKSYISVFASAHAGDDRVYADEEGYSEWLASLVEDGHIAPCPPHRVRAMLDTARANLQNAEAAQEKAPSATRSALVAHHAAEVEVLEAALGTDSKPKTAKVKGKSVTV